MNFFKKEEANKRSFREVMIDLREQDQNEIENQQAASKLKFLYEIFTTKMSNQTNYCIAIIVLIIYLKQPLWIKFNEITAIHIC